MIIVENRLKEMFDVLPEMVNEENDGLQYKPVFAFGDEKELNAFLIKFQEEKPYPLVWLESPYEELQQKTKVSLTQISLILGVESNPNMLNIERLKTNYENILIPLYDNVVELFKKSNIINFDYDEVKVTKFPHYVLDDENKTVDVWDALKMTFDCSIINDCFRKEIKFINYD